MKTCWGGSCSELKGLEDLSAALLAKCLPLPVCTWHQAFGGFPLLCAQAGLRGTLGSRLTQTVPELWICGARPLPLSFFSTCPLSTGVPVSTGLNFRMTPGVGVAGSQPHSQGQGQQGEPGPGWAGVFWHSGLPHPEVPALGSSPGGTIPAAAPLRPSAGFLPSPVACPGEEGGWEPAR